ncbi:hypothetical protein SEA_LASTHOPE_50 [Mycobacterium phage LastHope]|uniref:Uncharacterized protein n=1 Tax=Mycobacterium phage LastHope TaxID=2015886 RepID=A0A222ZRS5_9CAUD|nr:hypothetical protein I5G99_gp058 [Mycobacterium phage LastHope]ASR87218.1 hypothetical protein SEA_LASTHOPE_50 [Mycobacterium phage LastHope]
MSNRILTHRRRVSPDRRPGERLGAIVGVFLLHLAMTIVGGAVGALWIGLYLGAPW